MIEKIGELYADSKLSNIIVREVSSNPFVFGWTNDTLTQPNCPKDPIRSLLLCSDMLNHYKGYKINRREYDYPRCSLRWIKRDCTY